MAVFARSLEYLPQSRMLCKLTLMILTRVVPTLLPLEVNGLTPSLKHDAPSEGTEGTGRRFCQ